MSDGYRHVVTGNLLSVIGGEMMLRAATLGAAVVIARRYGPEALGLYTAALAFATLLTTIADGGLQVSTVSELSRRMPRIGGTVTTLYLTKSALLLVAAALSIAAAILCRVSSMVWTVTALITAKTILYAYGQLQFGILKAIGRMRPIGMIQSAHCGLLATALGVTCWRHWPIVPLLLLMCGAQAVELALSAAVLWLARVRPSRTRLAECWRMLRVSAPVGVSQMLANLILRLDVLVVNGLFSATVVGYFAAANNAVVVMYVCSWLFGSVLLPDLVRHHADSSARLDSFVRKWARMVCLATVPAAIVLAVASPLLIRTLYGPSFAPAGTPLAIMSLALPLILMNSLLFNRAVAMQSRPVYVGAYIVAAIAALLLNLVCGRAFGVVGVAWAIFAREALQALAFLLGGRIVSCAASPSSITAVALPEVASD